MVNLEPMTIMEFEAFLERDIRNFAEANVQGGYWDNTGALERSRREHKRLLSDGLATRNHYFYTIRNEEGAVVGMIWMTVDLSSQQKPFGFVYNLEIDEPYRRKGYATQAMSELEKVAKGFGLKQLQLHVFAHNQAARALYGKLGYALSSMNMLKEL